MSDINIKVNVVSQAAQASVGNLARQAKVAEKGFSKLNIKIKNSGSALKSFAGNLAAIGVSKAVGAIARGFTSMASAIFDATISLETATTQFEVLSGSAATATQIIKDLQDFTARTPFRFADVAKAGQTLLAFGFTTEQVKDSLQDLGDVAAATGQPLKDISLIFGQVAAAGKLTGERLLQLEERGIILGPALAKVMGTTRDEVRKLVSEGKVDFQTFETAFKSLNEKGSIAFGGIDKQSKTLSGRISTLKDNFEIFSAKIGDTVAPALKSITTAITKFIQRLGESKGFEKFLLQVADNIPGALRFLGQSFILANKSVTLFRQFIGGLEIVLSDLTAATLATAEAFVRLFAISSLITFQDDWTESIKQTAEELKVLRKAAISTGTDSFVANQRIAESSDRLNKQIQNSTNFIIKSYKDEVSALEANKNATVDNNAAKAKSAAQAAAAVTAAQKKENEEKLALLQGARVAEDELNAAKLEAELLADGEIDAREQIKIQKRADELATIRENEAENLLQRLGDDKAFQEAKTANQLAQLKRSNAIRAAEGKAAKAEADQADKDAKAKVKRTADTFQSITTLSSLGSAGLFKIAKGFQTANATIDGFAAIQKAASAAAFPANLPGIIIETARAATTVAGIRSQSPRFQQGGIVPGGQNSGDNVFARVNSGEMILNRSQQANLFDIANGGSGSGKPIEVTTVVQIGEEEIARAVSRQVAQGFEIGEGGV